VPGDLLPVEDYTPLQYELPSLYGVGEMPLPDSASPERRAAARQLQGYLLLFEQFLVDLTAQLGNINRFFSADADEEVTYFTRPLFELPGIQALLKRFPLDGDWSAFVTNPNNPVIPALRSAAESPEQRLDRRNRMFDHLLARQGEDMAAFGQELHRWAQQELLAGNIPPDQLLSRIADRRNAANTRLIRAKAALLQNAPELNAFRLLAVGNILGSHSDLLRIDPVIDSTNKTVVYRWALLPDGQDRLHSAAGFDSTAAAAITAEEAMVLASQQAYYKVITLGVGLRRFRLTDGTNAGARPVGDSPLSYASDAEANAAIAETVAVFAALRLASSRAPMEQWITHQTGIRSLVRRRLLTPTDANFEIFDEARASGLIAKRWRLWQLPGHTGQLLLSSASNFEAATDAAAIALAQDSIRQVLRYGIDEWNYVSLQPTETSFAFELQNPSGQLLALRNPPLGSKQEVEQRIAEIVAHLYPNYSAEGFHLVEHLLFRPRQVGNAFLSLPIDADRRERDPYSQRISIIFPSGYARDFSVPRASTPTTQVAPDRFRDPEFRRHAERMVQQSCPAHLLATVYWVDQQTPGSPNSPASFDHFEDRYFSWLDTLLIPGASAATLDKTRMDLVESLNAIANG
jgi:hypothetical protein